MKTSEGVEVDLVSSVQKGLIKLNSTYVFDSFRLKKKAYTQLWHILLVDFLYTRWQSQESGNSGRTEFSENVTNTEGHRELPSFFFSCLCLSSQDVSLLLWQQWWSAVQRKRASEWSPASGCQGRYDSNHGQIPTKPIFIFSLKIVF